MFPKLPPLRKLAQIDRVNLLVVWGYAPSDAVAPIVPALNLPVLLGSLSPVGIHRPEILNLAAPLHASLDPLIRYLQLRQPLKTALVAAQVGSMQQWAQTLSQALPALTDTKVDIVLPEQMDFRSLITRLKSAGVRSVGLFLTPPQIKIFIAQARTIKFAPAYFGMDTFNDSEIHALFATEAQGPIFADADIDPEYGAYYTKKFGPSEHIVEAARGDLLAQMLLHIANSSGPTFSKDAITQALHTFPSGKGPAGVYKLVEDSRFGSYLWAESVLYGVSSGKVERR